MNFWLGPRLVGPKFSSFPGGNLSRLKKHPTSVFLGSRIPIFMSQETAAKIQSLGEALMEGRHLG